MPHNHKNKWKIYASVLEKSSSYHLPSGPHYLTPSGTECANHDRWRWKYSHPRPTSTRIVSEIPKTSTHMVRAQLSISVQFWFLSYNFHRNHHWLLKNGVQKKIVHSVSFYTCFDLCTQFPHCCSVVLCFTFLKRETTSNKQHQVHFCRLLRLPSRAAEQSVRRHPAFY